MKRKITPSLKIYIADVKNRNEYKELINVFIKPDEYEYIENDGDADIFIEDFDKDEVKKKLYMSLSEITGKTNLWGIMTGVKPLKLYDKLVLKHNDKEVVRQELKRKYILDDGKCSLLEQIHYIQKDSLRDPDDKTIGIYIGIPFCPTRCTYCSFTSNQRDYEETEKYLNALIKEIEYVGLRMKNFHQRAESIYIGGGTPTTLRSDDLDKLLKVINSSIPTIDNCEKTLEAGRPDTLDKTKVETTIDNGITRISINPQSMLQDTLDTIGRDHSVEDIHQGFNLVKESGLLVNADIIAGLPGEDIDDFVYTLNEIIKLNPENITVHTLTMKRGSRLIEKDSEHNLKRRGEVIPMLEKGKDILENEGYRPYYIYRQQNMVDNLENVGYAKKGSECKYNIRIMEEKQDVLGLGAGGSTKIFFPEENRLERVLNVSNYEIYIERIDEMLKRKEDEYFRFKEVIDN